MKVVISWSGNQSLVIAKALKDWLPLVIQSVDPWLSAENIRKGTLWRPALTKVLEDCSFGIACLTPGNLNSTWIHFEAGALTKAVAESFLCTYLLDVEPSAIPPPLGDFNHTKAEKDDTRRLLGTLNEALKGDKRPSKDIDRLFELLWPEIGYEDQRGW
jgi:hypothetical protein